MRLFRLARWLGEEEAATSVEYAVILALILMVLIGGIAALGGEAESLWGWIRDRLNAFWS